MLCCPYATEKGIVLPIIPHQVNSDNVIVLCFEFADDLPALVSASIINQNYLIIRVHFRKECYQCLDEDRKTLFTIVNRDDYTISSLNNHSVCHFYVGHLLGDYRFSTGYIRPESSKTSLEIKVPRRWSLTFCFQDGPIGRNFLQNLYSTSIYR